MKAEQIIGKQSVFLAERISLFQTLPPQLDTYFICDVDVSSSVEQHFYHVQMFVLSGPDDRRPAPAVLKPTNISRNLN